MSSLQQVGVLLKLPYDEKKDPCREKLSELNCNAESRSRNKKKKKKKIMGLTHQAQKL
jgi:hypothetical protein